MNYVEKIGQKAHLLVDQTCFWKQERFHEFVLFYIPKTDPSQRKKAPFRDLVQSSLSIFKSANFSVALDPTLNVHHGIIESGISRVKTCLQVSMSSIIGVQKWLNFRKFSKAKTGKLVLPASEIKLKIDHDFFSR